MQTPQSKLSD